MNVLTNQLKMETQQIIFKDGDVYHAYFKNGNESNHCFEGLLIAKELDSEIILYDTYWATFGGNGGKTYSANKAIELFNLSFYRNLSDYDLQNPVKNPQSSYLEHDFIFLHRQHACVESCTSYFLRNGAKKSKVIMLHALENKLTEARRKQKSYDWTIECINKDIQKVHNGEIVYI